MVSKDNTKGDFMLSEQGRKESQKELCKNFEVLMEPANYEKFLPSKKKKLLEVLKIMYFNAKQQAFETIILKVSM